MTSKQCIQTTVRPRSSTYKSKSSAETRCSPEKTDNIQLLPHPGTTGQLALYPAFKFSGETQENEFNCGILKASIIPIQKLVNSSAFRSW